jgi:hypothetical protein
LVLDVRLAGGYARSLVGFFGGDSPSVGEVKRAVRGLERLARDNQGSLGDPVLLRRIEMAMQDEERSFAAW